MKKLLLAATAAIACAGVTPAVAQVATQAAPQARMTKAMKPVTRAEVGQRAERRFIRLDANKDGFVTQEETQAVGTMRAQKRQDRAATRAQRDPAARFARLDANADGQITRAEAKAARAARGVSADRKPARARGNGAGGLFARGDANKDGVISRAEFDSLRVAGANRMASKAARRAAAPGRMLAMADANKDGRLSLQEATTASLRRFDSLDLNRDGTVMPDERRQARQQKRAARAAR